MLKKIIQVLRGMVRSVLSPFRTQEKIDMRTGRTYPVGTPWRAGLHQVSAKEGAVLVLDHGIEVYYPPSPEMARDEVMDTLDFLRYALNRPDWQGEWQCVNEEELRREAEDALLPRLTVLEGGLPDEPYEN